jgi:hypothetical protein
VNDPVQKYLDAVIAIAGLSEVDSRLVRAELNEHLQSLISGRTFSTPQEVFAMLEHEFGRPEQIGDSIGRTKGGIRTFFRKRRKLPLTIAAAVLLTLTVRAAVAQEFYSPSNCLAPVIPQGSRIFVYKLARSFAPDDVIVFRKHDYYELGIVQRQQDDMVLVAKYGQPDQWVRLTQIIGRVFLNTR